MQTTILKNFSVLHYNNIPLYIFLYYAKNMFVNIYMLKIGLSPIDPFDQATTSSPSHAFLSITNFVSTFRIVGYFKSIQIMKYM
jgi:hypothetical protein